MSWKERLDKVKQSVGRSGQTDRPDSELQVIQNQPADSNRKGGFLKQLNLLNVSKSVGAKLFMLIFSSILFCVLVVGLLSYQISKGIIESKVAEFSEQTIKQTASKMDIIFKSFEDNSLQLIFDPEFQTSLNGLVRDNLQSYERFQNIRILETQLQALGLSNSTVAGTHLISLNPEQYPSIVTSGKKLDADELLQTEWLKETLALNGRVNWVPMHIESLNGTKSEHTIVLTRLVKLTTTSQESYVLMIEVKYGELQKYLTQLDLGESSVIRIVDRNNRVIMTTGEEEELLTENTFALPETNVQEALLVTNGNEEQVLAAVASFQSMDWQLIGEIPVRELVKDARNIQQLTILMALVSALVAAGIGFIVIRIIAVPLSQLRTLMNEGERGNLIVRSKIQKQDEIGQLARSFNQMMSQITALVNQTNQSAREVLQTAGELTEASNKTALSAKEIAVATEEIATGATSLAVEAERGADLTSEIGAQMKKMIHMNQEMVASANQVEQVSAQGTEHMGILIEKTGLTEDMTRSMVDKVDKLKDSTGSIRKILDVLNSLTKQTNILSLNATIEAARAGVAGKGFMVVADEIRKLADQSRQSIDVVGQITETIQQEIEDTVEVLSEAYPLFQQQIASVKDANQLFLSVQEQMTAFVKRLDSVTGSIQELDQSQIVLSEAMENVSGVAEQSSATSEEVASLSNEQMSISDGLVQLSTKLEAVSKELQNSLSRFRT